MLRKASVLLMGLVSTWLSLSAAAASLDEYRWDEINPSAPWAPRAGQQVLNMEGSFYLIGGRTPIESEFIGASILWGDVWRSDDRGKTWVQLLEDAEASSLWKNRAYFQAVTKGGYLYVIGGQNFILVDNECPPFPTDPPCPEVVPASDFFNDVWRSMDGINWEPMTAAAPWDGRAGLSAVALGDDIYVMAGSKNDDEAIGGGGPLPRVYFNDVWKSSDDGATWQQMTAAAPWAPRAGGVVVVKDDWMYMIGGEAGFEGPYFNDTWRSQDGANWQLMSADGGWPSRPGHKCGVVDDEIVCFGGFGLFANPVDMWSTTDGSSWTDLQQAPWNAMDPLDVKYDFDVVTTDNAQGVPDTIYTFGGDRERFDLPPEVNVNLVDNDVWAWSREAQRPPSAPAVPVPSMAAWSTTLLIGLLLAVAGWVLRRH